MPANLTKDATRVGFIGLGRMGSRLARRLHDAGWTLEVWNRTPGPALALSGPGVAVSGSAASLAAGSDVLLSCLSNDAAVRAVFLGKGGVLASARPGTVILEMSTISPALSREIHALAAQRGIDMLDLAISGSTPAVEAGTITLLAGGKPETFALCTPIYESIARQWFLIGPAGSGVQMKLVVNLLLGVGMEAIAEALSLGGRLGIDHSVLLDVLSRTAVIPPALAGKFKKIRTGDYRAEFPIRLMFKDLGLILDAAASSGASLPAARAAQQAYALYAERSGDLDLSAIAEEAPERPEQCLAS